MYRRSQWSMFVVLALALAACSAPPKTEPEQNPDPIVGAGVRITQAPQSPTRDRDASLTVECEREGCTIECRLDGAAFATCTSPVQYAALADGLHSFEARAKGATDAPAKHEWTVDATGPTVTISSKPASVTNQTSADFVLACSDSACTFECGLDGAAPSSCAATTSFTALAPGAHAFVAIALDALGNRGAPATYDWTVDASGPVVTFNSAPPALSGSSTATFQFTCDETNCTLTCSLDGATAAACTSPVSRTGLGDGAHTFTVIATDAAGNTGAAATHTWQIDTQGPTVSFTSAPPATTGATSASFSFTCSESNCTFSCSLDGATTAACTSPVTRTGLTDGAHNFTVVATDAAGNASAAATHTWTVSSAAPVVTLNAAPTTLTNQSAATFSFSCSQTGCTYSCSMDGATASSCTSPVNLSGLNDGVHSFSVTATSATGVTGAATTHSWQIDTAPPTASVSSAPAQFTNQTTASFDFACSESPCTFSCSLDGAAAASCTSPASRSGLSAGAHTFTVTATDAAGNTGSATASWTVDLTAPTVSFTTTPPSSTGATATFDFGCSETGCTFKCALDGATPASCTSPQSFSSLSDGSHTFSVTATDAAGNTSTAATHTFTVNTALPVVTLGSTPSALTNQTSATFNFTCDQSGCTFECSLDGAAYAACNAPKTYNALAAGGHAFGVRPVSANGTGAAATFSWTVDTQAPTLSIGSSPSNPTNSTSASFTFSASETGCSFSCTLDGVSASCTSPAGYSSLASGSHTFSVVATDAAGNPSAAQTVTWVIDLTPPTVTFQITPQNPSTSTNASFFWTDSETGCTFTCSLDGAAATSCTSPASRSGLAQGPHTFTINSVDPAGNAGTPVTYSWSIDSIPPTVTLSAAPTSPTNATDASFTFSCNKTPCTLTCFFDGSAVTCTSPKTFTGLADGNHTFSVYGQDSAGNLSAQVNRSWTVDTAPPQTVIVSGPPNGPGTTASFQFNGGEICTFECSLDGAPFAACTQPKGYSGLSNGQHTFQVKATDLAGNPDLTPASYSWFVATTYISSIQPSSGIVGVPMIIEGAGFGASQGTSAVMIGGVSATVRFWSDKYLVVIVPTGLPEGAALVDVTPFGTAQATYDVQPWVRGLSPLEPNPGDAFTLTGSSLGTSQGTVTIGGTAATIQSWSDTSVTVTIPAASKGRVAVALRTASGRRANLLYTTVRGSDVWLVRNGDVPEGRDNSTAVWTGTELIVWGGAPSGNSIFYLNTGGRYDPVSNSWRPMSTVGAPVGRSGHTAIWTGKEMIVFGGFSYNGVGYTYYSDGGRYDPVTDTWAPLSPSGLPGRYGHTAVWTGSRMIVFGGFSSTSSGSQTFYNTGAIYDPASNSWSALSTVSAPAGRTNHTANWINGEMYVWGGLGSFSSLHNTGARYNPVTDQWTALPTTGAPAGRQEHTATWTGSDLVVFGGGNSSGTAVATGGRYNLATNSWSAIASGPTARMNHTAVWTGSRVVIYGGMNGSTFTNTGSQYDPVGNSWTPTSITGAATRSSHTAAWTGVEMLAYGYGNPQVGRYDPNGDAWTSSTSPPAVTATGTAQWTGTEMIAWGGGNTSQGQRYNPATDTYSNTSSAGAPQGRTQPTSVWTGTEMIVWGGNNSGNYLNTGGRYDPVTDSWTLTSTVNAPPGRTTDSVWTGTEFIIWGGISGLSVNTYHATGGRYSPATDTWTATSTVGAPIGRWGHTMVWTGSEVVVWGGYNASGYLNNGARYNPSTDTWTPISAVGAPSARSGMHAAWTGTDVVIYGGYGNNQYLGNGARYNPTTDTWTALPLTNSPGGRENSTGVWTGSELIVWGGRMGGVTAVNTGARFHAANNAWTAMTTVGAPQGRSNHYAAWTGSAMVVIGGYYGGNGAALYFP